MDSINLNGNVNGEPYEYYRGSTGPDARETGLHFLGGVLAIVAHLGDPSLGRLAELGLPLNVAIFLRV